MRIAVEMIAACELAVRGPRRCACLAHLASLEVHRQDAVRGLTIEICVPNSGGYGDPLERDPAMVLSDVLDGFTTVELAERDYGVVLDLETMSLDAEATARLREERTTVQT